MICPRSKLVSTTARIIPRSKKKKKKSQNPQSNLTEVLLCYIKLHAEAYGLSDQLKFQIRQ